jgi:hydrogenase expression/formation protein HypE
VELSVDSQKTFVVEEDAIPVSNAVTSACEVLGFDPLYVANEGRFAAFLPADQASEAVALLANRTPDLQPAVIGEVGDDGKPIVVARSPLGTERVIDMLSGDQLPRIC